MAKKKRKLKDRDSLVKYITEKQKGIRYYSLYSLTNFGGSYRAIEELDVIEQLLKYINKLMDKTPTFKDYLEKRQKGMASFEATQVEKKREYISKIDEEVFYLIGHINHYEEQNNE